MLSTGEVRITIDPNVNVPVNMEFFRSGVGEVGDLTTFDSTAEIETMFFSGEGQVGAVTIFHPVTGVGMTSAFGSVLVPGVVSTISPTSFQLLAAHQRYLLFLITMVLLMHLQQLQQLVR